MNTGELLKRAREAAGVSQDWLARHAGTSRPTLSAYERGHKSPSLVTAQRLLDQIECELAVRRRIRFVDHVRQRGGVVSVPTSLPCLDAVSALARVSLPLHVNWSDPSRSFNLADRRQRARVYEMVLRDGTATDVLAFVDGRLLVDLWEELVLPREVRTAWEPLVSAARGPQVDESVT